jgi:hypothetical protein
MKYATLLALVVCLGCSNPASVDTIGSYEDELAEAIALELASDNPDGEVCFKYASGRVSPPYYETCVRLWFPTGNTVAEIGNGGSAFRDCDPSTIRCWAEWNPLLQSFVYRCDMGDCSVFVFGDD